MKKGSSYSKHSIDDIVRISPLSSLRHRLPWLVIGLLGGFAAAQVISIFDKTLKENLVLAAFIPLIVYVSDAVGTQMEAFTIREIGMHERLNFTKYFVRQFIIVLLMAVILGIVTLAITLPLYKDFNVSFVISLSVFAAILSSIFTGLLIPYFFSNLRLDPANASGPIATIIQDLVSVTIYFLIASALL